MAKIIINKSIEDIVNKYAQILQEELPISAIYLFGSYSTNNYTTDSDIDIAVVSDSFTGDPIEDTMKLMRIRRKIDLRIEPHPFTTVEFDISIPFIAEIIKTGKRIALHVVPGSTAVQ